MASYFRVTMGYHMDTVGFSETYVTKEPIELNVLNTRLEKLLTLRNALLWTNCAWDGVRVSDLGSTSTALVGTRKSQLLPPGPQVIRGNSQPILIPVVGVRTIFPTGERPDQGNAAIHLQMFLSNGTNKIRYFAPIPDSLSGYEPLTYDGERAKSWDNSLGTYLVEVAANWATVGRSGPPTYPYVPVTGAKLVAPAPATFGVQVPQSPPFSVTEGDKVQLRGFRMCRGIPRSLNKIWYVDSVVDEVSPSTKRTIYLRNSTSYLPSDIRVLGTIQRVAQGLVTFADIRPLRVRTHKRGRPLSSRPGRRKTPIQAPC